MSLANPATVKEELISHIAGLDPLTENDRGDCFCFFCREEVDCWDVSKGWTCTHSPDCIWRRARLLRGLP